MVPKKNSAGLKKLSPTECIEFGRSVQTIYCLSGERFTGRRDRLQESHESSRCRDAGGILNIFKAAVFFTILFDKTSGHEILKLLVCTETEHFFPAADGISSFQVLINDLKKGVKPEGLFVRKYGDQLISNMIWNPS
jgi:hypothetical protein